MRCCIPATAGARCSTCGETWWGSWWLRSEPRNAWALRYRPTPSSGFSRRRTPIAAEARVRGRARAQADPVADAAVGLNERAELSERAAKLLDLPADIRAFRFVLSTQELHAEFIRR